MELPKELKDNQNVVLVISEKTYKFSTLRMNKRIVSNFNSVCYITATEPAASITAIFGKEGVDLKKYHFVDCISKKTSLGAPLEQIRFVPAPTALTTLSIAITEAVEAEKSDLLFLDSISSLLLYNKELTIVKFVHALMNKVRETNAKGIFLILKSDLDKPLVKEIELFADKVLEYEFLE